jgi:hypothetical protein
MELLLSDKSGLPSPQWLGTSDHAVNQGWIRNGLVDRFALDIGIDVAIRKMRRCPVAPGAGALRATNFFDLAIGEFTSSIAAQYSFSHELLLLSDVPSAL